MQVMQLPSAEPAVIDNDDKTAEAKVEEAAAQTSHERTREKLRQPVPRGQAG